MSGPEQCRATFKALVFAALREGGLFRVAGPLRLEGPTIATSMGDPKSSVSAE